LIPDWTYFHCPSTTLIAKWPENQILIPDWAYFHCPASSPQGKQHKIKLSLLSASLMTKNNVTGALTVKVALRTRCWLCISLAADFPPERKFGCVDQWLGHPPLYKMVSVVQSGGSERKYIGLAQFAKW